jgi:predicted DNA-binding protein
MDLRGEKLGDLTIHLKLPPELHEQLRVYSEFCDRPVSRQIVMIIDEYLNGRREARLAAAAAGRK